MIALDVVKTMVERGLGAAQNLDPTRVDRLAAHKRSRFAALTPASFGDVTNHQIRETYNFISAHIALPCPLHDSPLNEDQLGRALGDLGIETPKMALWFLVVVVIVAAVAADGCTCPSGHSGGTPNNPGSQPPDGGKP